MDVSNSKVTGIKTIGLNRRFSSCILYSYSWCDCWTCLVRNSLMSVNLITLFNHKILLISLSIILVLTRFLSEDVLSINTKRIEVKGVNNQVSDERVKHRLLSKTEVLLQVPKILRDFLQEILFRRIVSVNQCDLFSVLFGKFFWMAVTFWHLKSSTETLKHRVLLIFFSTLLLYSYLSEM